MLLLDQQIKILDTLKADGFLVAEKYEALKKEANEGEDILLSLRKQGFQSSEQAAMAMAKLFSLPYIDLRGVKVEEKKLKILPADVANNYQLAIFDLVESVLKVALVDPTNLKAQEAMDYIAREKEFKVEYYITTPESLASVLKQYSELKTEVSEALDIAKDKLAEKKEAVGKKNELEEVTEEMIQNAPIAKLVSVVLKHAVDAKASDVHIE
ncbi:hypothetical protein COX27_02305, partial [Candidatus Kuenenbacteria bacterium CG23_combo_of_CG06-09_8_20_14_all_36_9]